jgi:hypothetical protein
MQDLAKHANPWFFFTMVAKKFPLEKTNNEIEHKGIGVKLIRKSKHYRKCTRAHNLCKYETPNCPKTITIIHQFFYKGSWHQKM